MITRETDYAIRALLRLAQQGEGERLSAAALSAEMGIPYRFLRRILLKLGQGGLLCSLRGRRGGLALSRPAGAIDLLQIVRAVHPESVTLNRCLTGHAHACPRQPHCAVHEELAAIQREIDGRLAEITLERLVAREQTGGGARA